LPHFQNLELLLAERLAEGEELRGVRDAVRRRVVGNAERMFIVVAVGPLLGDDLPWETTRRVRSRSSARVPRART
jgi:hypothetical protein